MTLPTDAVIRPILYTAVALGLAVPLIPAKAAAAEQFTAAMSGDSEVPPTVAAPVRPWKVTVAHLHGPAPAGANAGVEVPLGNAPNSPIRGEATLSAEQVEALEQGKLYANVHTPKHPGGEIRGQLAKGA